jgi:hypothetical protein
VTVPATGSDRTTLWGVLGIISAICCWPIGVLFGILSLTEARKWGKTPTLAYVAFVIAGLNFIGSIIAWSTGGIHVTRT